MTLRFMFTTHGNISEEQVRSVLNRYAFGKLDPHTGIQIVDTKCSRRRSQRKFYVHYMTASTALSDRRLDFNERKQMGEVVDPPRIKYGHMRDGTPMYWYISICKDSTDL